MFFVECIKYGEIKYKIMQKQSYALVKALNDFREYALQSQIIAFVPDVDVKQILCQPQVDGRWSKWITKIQEFDFVMKPAKLV